MDKPTAALLCFGRGGHTLYAWDNPNSACSSQGYAHPDDFCKPYHWWADPPGQLTRHWDNWIVPQEGVPVIDKTEAVGTALGFQWVFHGPMPNLKRDAQAYVPCPQPSPIFAAAVAGNEYGALLGLQATSGASPDNPGPLDSVPLAEYVNGWRDHGARIGHLYVDGETARIEWEG